MKRKKAIDFLLVTVFVGILLTVVAVIGMGGFLRQDSSDERGLTFNERFYNDAALVKFVKYVDYKVFGHIESDDMLIGKNDWLFEAVDSKNGYDRLLDYIGGNEYTEAELEKIAKTVSDRAADYEKENIEYMMIVIPDSITVCSENVPWYLGKQSDNTRLSQVTAYVADKEIGEFINLAPTMIAESEELVMYNNTENSINAYGAYCIYNTVVSRLLAKTGQEVDRIYREDVDFYTRLTEGKTIAEKAGLARTIRNRTVSISDGMKDEYSVTYNEKSFMITVRDDATLEGAYDCVVVEYTDDWDRIQLMPYFSNTFDKVYYRGRLMEQPSTSKQYGATLVVQIIHESELDMLLK